MLILRDISAPTRNAQMIKNVTIIVLFFAIIKVVHVWIPHLSIVVVVLNVIVLLNMF